MEVTIAIRGGGRIVRRGNDPIYKTIEEKQVRKPVPQNVTWDDADQKNSALGDKTASFPDIFAGDFVASPFTESGLNRARSGRFLRPSSYPQPAGISEDGQGGCGYERRPLLYDPPPDLRGYFLQRPVTGTWYTAGFGAGCRRIKELETYDEFRDMPEEK